MYVLLLGVLFPLNLQTGPHAAYAVAYLAAAWHTVVIFLMIRHLCYGMS